MKNLLRLFLFFSSVCCFSQETKVIDVTSDRLEINEEKYPGATLLSKVKDQVHLVHEGIEIWCDQAVHYTKDRFVKAFGNVEMRQGDSIVMKSNYAEYNGITEFAYASTNVKLTTPENSLTTDTLFFDRKRQQAYYRSGGTVKDSSNTLKSKIGRYYMNLNKYRFTKDVTIINSENTVNSEQLDYFTDSGYTYLHGASTVKSPGSTLYCERGFYNTKTNIGYVVKNARIDYDNRIVYGDSIYYDSNKSFASATNNIKVIDTSNHSLIKGHYAEVFRAKDSVFITKRALAISKQTQDSIFIHSDTIMVTGKPDKRVLRGFYDVKMYKKGMSGKCDSVSMTQETGITKLLGSPILWANNNQMTGDTIQLISNLKTQKLDSLKVFNNSFIVQQDTLKQGYNQIKGLTLDGVFKNNELKQVDINKNAETVYFQRNENLDLIGINKIFCSRIKILFQDRQLIDAYYYDNVEGTLFQEENLPESDRKLKGLNWRGDEMITSKKDLFKDEKPFELTKIEGLPLPEVDKDFFDEETLKRINQNSSEESRFKNVKLSPDESSDETEENPKSN